MKDNPSGKKENDIDENQINSFTNIITANTDQSNKNNEKNLSNDKLIINEQNQILNGKGNFEIQNQYIVIFSSCGFRFNV